MEELDLVFPGSSLPDHLQSSAEHMRKRTEDMDNPTKSFDDAAKNALTTEEYDMLVASAYLPLKS